MGVEQVCGAVQRHGRLAGARTALHHERSRGVRADHLVLLGLDGGHDVPHPPGAGGRHGRQQRPLRLRTGVAALEESRIEDVVLEVADLTATQQQVTTPAHALAVRRRRLVEGAGLLRPPVHEESVLVLVREADASDVALLHVALGVRVEVETAEDEALVHRGELGQPVLVERGEGVPFRVVLHRPLQTVPADPAQLLLLLRPQRVQAGVPHGHALPLQLELRLTGGHGVGHRGEPRGADRGTSWEAARRAEGTTHRISGHMNAACPTGGRTGATVSVRPPPTRASARSRAAARARPAAPRAARPPHPGRCRPDRDGRSASPPC